MLRVKVKDVEEFYTMYIKIVDYFNTNCKQFIKDNLEFSNVLSSFMNKLRFTRVNNETNKTDNELNVNDLECKECFLKIVCNVNYGSCECKEALSRIGYILGVCECKAFPSLDNCLKYIRDSVVGELDDCHENVVGMLRAHIRSFVIKD